MKFLLIKAKSLKSKISVAAGLYFFLLITSSVFASFCDELPTGYTRSNVQTQLAEYRNIFDPIYEQVNGENPSFSRIEKTREMSERHADGLINVFENGVKITASFINKNPNHTSLRYLSEIWFFAKEKNKEKKFSANVFSALNNFMALLTSLYKEENINLKNLNVKIDDEYVKDIINSIDEISNKKKKENKHTINLTFSNFETYFPDRPNFIIYGNPDPEKPTKISEKTFVDQFFKYSYSGYVCLYDLNSKQKREGTKSDPHFSSENGTYNMLRHDQEHNFWIFKMEEKYENFKDWFSTLNKAYQMIKKINENDSKILYSGIFELFHDEGMNMFPKKEKVSLYEGMKHAVEEIKHSSTQRIDTYSRGDYKKQIRDAENILKNKNEEGKQFLPRISISLNKERPFPIAKTDDRKYIIVKDQRDFTESMKWVIPQKQAPENIRQERVEKYLKLALKKGNNEFWDRFLEIFKNNLNDS